MAAKLSQDELDVLVDAHEQWLKSKGESGKLLELKNVDVSGLTVRGLDLSKSEWSKCECLSFNADTTIFKEAVFAHCELSNSAFENAVLDGAFFDQCSLVGANFEEATVVATVFAKCNLETARFVRANGVAGTGRRQMDKAEFENCDLTMAVFSESNMAGVSFEASKLDTAVFAEASLNRANFDFVNAAGLGRVNFSGADLSRASFSNANLKDADFFKSNLNDAVFDNAFIEGADFEDASVRRTSFVDSRGIPGDWPEDDWGSMLIAGSHMHPMHIVNDPNLDEVNDFLGLDCCEFEGDDGIDQYFIVVKAEQDYEPLAVVKTDDFWDVVHNRLANTERDEAWEDFMYPISEAEVGDSVVRATGAKDCGIPGMRNVAAVVDDISVEGAKAAIQDLYENDRIYESSFEAVEVEDNDGGAVWVGGENLTYEQLEIIVDALEEWEDHSPTDLRELTTYGRKHKAAQQLKKVDKEMKLAAFKKMFPNAFEAVKGQLRKQTITPELAQELIKQFGMTWLVSDAEWDSELQRLCPCPDEVLQFNVDLAALTTNEKLLKTLRAIRQVSFESMHPVVYHENLLTVGWVRFCSFPGKNEIWELGSSSFGVLAREGRTVDKVLIVEEIQSDLPTVRKNVDAEGDFRRKLEEQGGRQAVEKALNLMQPFVDNFYHDALAAVFDLAAERGIDRVEMFTHATKKRFGSPMAVYEKLPKQMGMKKIPAESSRSIAYVNGIDPHPETVDPKMWAIQVINDNPRRRTRKRLPKTWTRHVGYR